MQHINKRNQITPSEIKLKQHKNKNNLNDLSLLKFQMIVIRIKTLIFQQILFS